MKILFTCDYFPPDVFGGTELIVYNLAKQLNNLNHEVTVMCFGKSESSEVDGIKTIRYKEGYWGNLLLFKYKPIFKEVDIVISFTTNTVFAATLLSKLYYKPMLVFWMGFYGKAWQQMSRFGRIRQFIERIQLSLSVHKHIFLSEFNRQLAISFGVAQEKTEVVLPSGAITGFDIVPKKSYVLFVGRLVAQKGIDHLFEAAKQLPEVRFVVVGHGSVTETPKNVELVGLLPQGEALRKLYAEALIFCLPSRAEGFGIVLLEAMSAGCAIVSTVPVDFEGIHIEPSPESISEAIKRLLADQVSTINMGEMNRKLAKEYDWQLSAAKLERIIRTIFCETSCHRIYIL